MCCFFSWFPRDLSLSFNDLILYTTIKLGYLNDIDYDNINRFISAYLGLSGTIIDINIIDLDRIEVTQTGNSEFIISEDENIKTTSRSVISAIDPNYKSDNKQTESKPIHDKSLKHKTHDEETHYCK